MKRLSLRKTLCTNAISKIIFVLILSSSSHVIAAGLTPEMESKIEAYKVKLVQWSNDKEIIKAVEEMNARVVSMTNKTWKTLAKDDSEVLKFQNSPAGQKLTEWQKDKSLGKLFLRDQKGNYTAGSKKPAIFNIAERKPFVKAIAGSPWNSKKPKTDPTTRLSSIQISAPVISDGKKIGVIHTSLIVD